MVTFTQWILPTTFFRRHCFCSVLLGAARTNRCLTVKSCWLNNSTKKIGQVRAKFDFFKICKSKYSISLPFTVILLWFCSTLVYISYNSTLVSWILGPKISHPGRKRRSSHNDNTTKQPQVTTTPDIPVNTQPLLSLHISSSSSILTHPSSLSLSHVVFIVVLFALGGKGLSIFIQIDRPLSRRSSIRPQATSGGVYRISTQQVYLSRYQTGWTVLLYHSSKYVGSIFRRSQVYSDQQCLSTNWGSYG